MERPSSQKPLSLDTLHPSVKLWLQDTPQLCLGLLVKEKGWGFLKGFTSATVSRKLTLNSSPPV